MQKLSHIFSISKYNLSFRVFLEVSKAQLEMNMFSRDIEYIRWLSEQHIEKARENEGTRLPKVLVSEMRRCGGRIRFATVLHVTY